ncbi:transcription termination factor Rho [Fannyhessea vaginae]|uniref:transcription termination factor Rho n=1 Tax=Fannyhessea vaginae TaxID=82135 RepID=UPI00076FDF32|nr:transcription termination factor Rho [Fannyhessea vaginae]KXG90576.1 transcription termination factor Rho [Fannyhessea vaginae]
MNQSGVDSVTPQKRRRGRPRKNQNPLDSSLDTSSQFVHEESKNEQTSEHELIKNIEDGSLPLINLPKRRRGRPRKADIIARQKAIEAALLAQQQSIESHDIMLKAQEVPSAVDLNISTQSNVVVSQDKSQKSETSDKPKSHRGASDIELKQTQTLVQTLTAEAAQNSTLYHETKAITSKTEHESEHQIESEIKTPFTTTPTVELRRHRRHNNAAQLGINQPTPHSAHENPLPQASVPPQSALVPAQVSANPTSSNQTSLSLVRQPQAAVKVPQVNVRFTKQQRRRGRKTDNAAPSEPSLTQEQLSTMKVAELRAKAQELGLETSGVRKKVLIEQIYRAAAASEGFASIQGVLDIQPDGYGFIRTGNYMSGDNDAFVHQQLIRQYGLRPGDWIDGRVSPSRNNKFPPLHKIVQINGKTPEEIRKRPRFRDLTPVYPDERLIMENGQQSITGRAIDLVAPIGKGQRGLIVSPPKAGKTTILKKICQSITANNPEVHLFCLLVDERPEEVTDMQRSIKGTVVASTFDMPAENHTSVSELVIEHAKRLVELGQDVVVVLDSITRLARAYNLAQPASGRVLSGGVDSAALYPPKKFLGAARNIEHGGSLTILASALIDTGSKMDEVIFEEFKGTGNMELKLDRDLADRRIFPAIDPVSSGTRNEDLLISKELQPFVWGLRRVLSNMNNIERAASALVKGLKETKDNEDFLIRSARKAQAIDYVDSPSKL